MGHIHRLQRRILPYTNSQSVQEEHVFSHPGPVLPVQKSTLWPVHSTHGVHSGGQRGQTDGFTEGYKNPPVPTLKVVAGGKQCASRSTITPSKTCSADIYRRIKRRVGCSLKRTARGTWPLPKSKLHINHLELKAVFLALKEFQDLCSNNTVLVATDNTTVVAYIKKKGG